MEQCSVFLGGSCNPTTWRREEAIPVLESNNISFFNPQVDEWKPELVAVEAKAKETAKCVLFVIDNNTRSIVSMNEAVEYIFRNHNVVVLVVQTLSEGTMVAGEALFASEAKDLNHARQYLRNIAERSNVPCFERVTDAVNALVEWFHPPSDDRDIKESNLSKAKQCELSRRLRLSSPKESERRLRKRSSIVLNNWPRRRMCKSKSQYIASTSALSKYAASAGQNRSKTLVASASETIGIPMPTRLSRHETLRHSKFPTDTSGVFLGGSIAAQFGTKSQGDYKSWRDSLAIPRLRDAGIPYHYPTFGSGSVEYYKENADLLLFVIDKAARNITVMIEAIELVCRGRAIILVVEDIPDGAILQDDECRVSGRQLSDLNRARMYLRETAQRNDVDVFDTVECGVDSLICRLQAK